jgi:succinate dehydrogenase / fumarate reductase flavoprotein subunit
LIPSTRFAEAKAGVQARTEQLLAIKGTRTPDQFHKALGHIMWEYCGMARNAEGLQFAKTEIQRLRKEFWSDVRVAGTGEELNQTLNRPRGDFLSWRLMIDTLAQRSCGGHFPHSRPPRARPCATTSISPT